MNGYELTTHIEYINDVYILRLQGDQPDRFLPPYMLEVGREFSKGWTTVQSEMNSEFGTQQYAAPFMLESQVGAFAQKYSVTDKAQRRVLMIVISFE